VSCIGAEIGLLSFLPPRYLTCFWTQIQC
jgi:hypothetical protein